MDLREGMAVNGSLVDNVYTGWSGEACIVWPEQHLSLTMRVPNIVGRGQNDGLCLLYRPPVGPAFCFEPVTHAIEDGIS